MVALLILTRPVRTLPVNSVVVGGNNHSAGTSYSLQADNKIGQSSNNLVNKKDRIRAEDRKRIGAGRRWSALFRRESGLSGGLQTLNGAVNIRFKLEYMFQLGELKNPPDGFRNMGQNQTTMGFTNMVVRLYKNPEPR